MGGVVAYVVVDAVLQLLPPHYSAVHEAESNLAVGRFGWIMGLNFLGRAATTLCMVAAIGGTGPVTGPRRTGMVLLAGAAASSATLAFFPTDIAAGGGIGSGDHTTGGLVHLWVAGAGFAAALSAVLVLTPWLRTSPGLAPVAPAGVVFASLASAGLLWLGLSGGFALGLLGLAERLCLTGILGWAFVVCKGIRGLR
ncbi:DUF998 domain-containing protein [Pseudarthrobacter sp. P1]|uniref:DUF998 domain-containing protein n=1 Tax=Pseudarthrobacter sp. P1 TaxID=3418418 RepID=UPI003CF67317